MRGSVSRSIQSVFGGVYHELHVRREERSRSICRTLSNIYDETFPIIYIVYTANQWTGFYMTGTAVMKELKVLKALTIFTKSSMINVWQNPYTSVFKANDRNTRARCEICSKLIIKTSERCQWLRSGVFIGNFEHI